MTRRLLCKAHRTSDGQPCQRWAMVGQTVCGTHGGRAPLAKAKGARLEAERKATEALSREGISPVSNPLEAFAALAGECVRLKDYLGSRVERLEEIRYSGLSGEQLRGELQAYGAALDRTIRVLDVYGRLNIDERLAQVNENTMRIHGQFTRAINEWLFPGEAEFVLPLLSALLAQAVQVRPDSDGHVRWAPEVPVEFADRIAARRRQVEDGRRVVELEAELAHARAEISALRVGAVRPPLAIEAAPADRVVDVEELLHAEWSEVDEGRVIEGEVVEAEPEPSGYVRPARDLGEMSWQIGGFGLPPVPPWPAV